MEIAEIFGWAGSAATLAAYSMKTMLPLRLAAIASNVLFICYSTMLGLWPMLFLDLILLPFNLWRTFQILSMRKRVESVRSDDPPDFSVLTSHSRPRPFDADETIFSIGDKPDALYYIESGEVLLEELGITLSSGDVFGEIAFFTDAKARTATARCVVPGRIHVVDESTFLRLHFQDPAFGMAIMKIITRRLIQTVERNPEVFRHQFGSDPVGAQV
ncbi:Crp/Fnr family transcriptional regulator [Tropicimonas sediminicola]|uniref:Cyclic nucleotide-binding domain-containing protein n=1 Tax=Tropicimonas sediminicola TaxID=1031541 RepID=A0A239M6X5_9RHOB|nr:cyclic nucleotide-binding domain-containing protein [Tropicimonas sediminicola]SNT37814.1 Cyclic nucleotide-binding domain-containing protein [Tropicimonas sediminicola]